MFKLLERLVYPIFILTAVIGLAYWYWTTTPGYALTQIVLAVKNKDADNFEKYVDIENIAYHAVDDLLHGPARDSGMFGNFDNMIGVGIISLFKPEIAEIARSQVLNFIKAGAAANVLPGKSQPAISDASTGTTSQTSQPGPAANAQVVPAETDSETTKPNVSSMFGGASEGGAVEKFTKNLKLQQQLKDYGLSKEGWKGVDYLKVEGTTALVGLSFNSEKLKRKFIIELKMEDAGGFWRVTELSNLNELISTYLQIREEMRSQNESSTLPSKGVYLLGGSLNAHKIGDLATKVSLHRFS